MSTEEHQELENRLLLLRDERKAQVENLEYERRKNEELLSSLYEERKQLLAQRRVISKGNPPRKSRAQLADSDGSIKQRKRLDQLRSQVTLKRLQLRTMQDKLNDMAADHKAVVMNEDSGEMKQIRLLENKLDKAMIKYNEAQSIRKTYEQIVKQLKEERVAYDNQLAAVERSLKGKEHDFEELQLLSHDASHAKETSEAELNRFEAQITVERMTRERNVQEKKYEVEKRLERTKQQELSENKGLTNVGGFAGLLGRLSAGMVGDPVSVQRTEDELQKIRNYENALRRIKEATGVSDTNDIIQKFSTQEETAKELQKSKNEQQEKVRGLHEQQGKLKHQVESWKYSKLGNVEGRRQLDEIETRVVATMAEYERTKERTARSRAILNSVKPGIEHIAEKLSGVKLEGHSNIQVSDHNLFEALQQNKKKLQFIYAELKGSQLFELIDKEGTLVGRTSDTAQRTASVLQAIYSVPELSATANKIQRKNEFNCRVRISSRNEDELSDEGIDDDSEGDADKKVETQLRFEALSKGLKGKRTRSAKLLKK